MPEDFKDINIRLPALKRPPKTRPPQDAAAMGKMCSWVSSLSSTIMVTVPECRGHISNGKATGREWKEENKSFWFASKLNSKVPQNGRRTRPTVPNASFLSCSLYSHNVIAQKDTLDTILTPSYIPFLGAIAPNWFITLVLFITSWDLLDIQTHQVSESFFSKQLHLVQKKKEALGVSEPPFPSFPSIPQKGRNSWDTQLTDSPTTATSYTLLSNATAGIIGFDLQYLVRLIANPQNPPG